MSTGGVTRRDFLQAATTLGAGLAVSSWAAAPVGANVLAPRKRKSIISLNVAELAAWRAGVQVMRDRSSADPADKTGWLFQANIHGADPSGPFTNKCQHRHWWFLPWHRMYLYYFERILLKAIDASGVARPVDFGLPYFDYTGDAPGMSVKRTLPQALRDRMYVPSGGAASAVNPLFEMNRNSALNREIGPSPLPASAVSTTTAFGFSNFINSDPAFSSGFGGRNRATPIYSGTPSHAGAFEGTPHGTIHNGIGGKMSAFETAAQDPVFWTHHCNLDRLWNLWLAGAITENPDPASSWGQQQFTFFDENGNQVTERVFKFLNSVAGNLIDYTYDDGSAPPAGPLVVVNAAQTTEQAAAPEAESHAAGHALGAKLMSKSKVLVAFPPRFTLSAEQSSVGISIPESARETVESAALVHDSVVEAAVRPGQMLLLIEGIEMAGVLDGYYEVYLNLPDGVAPDFSGPYYVGNVVPFALRGHDGHAADAELSPPSVALPIARVVRGIRRAKGWNKASLKVTFVPQGVDDVKEKSAPRLTFRGFRIISQPTADDPQPEPK